MTFKTSVFCAGKSGCFSFANTAAQSLFLQFCFLQFLSPLQMVEVADGRGRVRLRRTAVALHHSRYDPERLSFLCQCLFGLFGLNTVHWKNKEEGWAGQLANRAELKRERKESGQSHLYWLLIQGWRFCDYVLKQLAINLSRVMYVIQNVR